jgi:hypothetical protein
MRPWRSSPFPAVARDRDELSQRGVELLFACPLQALTEDRHDLGLRAAVDEDDEAEAEALFVLAVEPVELGERRGIVVRSLFRRRVRRQLLRADRRVRVQRPELLVLGEGGDDVVGRVERVVTLREPLDERRLPLEELRELLLAQLPR